ncbi:MAG TPA: sigma-54 dependent transcriptional regulator [Gemmatimonadales bacterium]|nr:sigma-54 dependent transcriptional regulator [Gemmatimonadales bacterium]
MSHRILVIDDETGIREALRQVLEYEGYQVKGAGSGPEGLELYGSFRPHLVLLDVKMAGLDGLETLARLRDLDPQALVVMISGHGTISTAVTATHRGAFDFLEKPLDTDRLLITLRNALAQVALTSQNEKLKRVVDTRYGMAGHSRALRVVLELIERVGPTQARVLITGENGTGKELVARALHQRSPRKSEAFVEVNCAAIPAELIESELFGHVKGSFTGAVGDRAGKFEQADAGTLFLDEIGDMTLSAQAKVLRALQEGIITRVGGSKPIEVDVRVLAATNKKLEREIAAGRFREDLYYRLNVVPIEVPPLSDRREDIPDLVACFSERLAESAGIPNRAFDKEALDKLRQRSWPGNVRELRNIVERILVLSQGKSITAADVARFAGGVAPAAGSVSDFAVEGDTLADFRDDSERSFLEAKLRENDWNIAETARILKIPRSNLYKKIERFGLTRGPT